MFKGRNNGEGIMFVYGASLLRGLLASLLLLVIATVLFFFTQLDESYMKLSSWAITVIGIFITAFYGSIKRGKAGLVNGMALGLIFTVILAIFALLEEHGSVDTVSWIIKLVMGIMVGGLSGIMAMVAVRKS